MSAFGALDRGTRVAVLLLGGAALAGIGYLGWQMTRPAPQVEAEAVAPAASTDTATTPAADTGTASAADPVATDAADTARLCPDAHPGSCA